MTKATGIAELAAELISLAEHLRDSKMDYSADVVNRAADALSSMQPRPVKSDTERAGAGGIK